MATNLARAPYDVSVKNTNTESSKLKLYVDDLPQAYEPREKSAKKNRLEPTCPFSGMEESHLMRLMTALRL